MKSSAQVVVIGGGVVGASVLFHLTENGWTDVVLVERKELTAGSTWHAAGGMHTLNGDPNVAQLQQYTVQLYQQIEERSGQDCSIHLPGGITLASDTDRMDWLEMAVARGRYLGMDGLEMISPKEAQELFPLLDPRHFLGAMWDPVEGHVDPTGVTNAYAICARQAGAEIYRQTWVSGLEQRPDGTWTVVTRPSTGNADDGERHEIHAEHVVNAGGLWAREVGRMAGLELPVLAMQHHYLVTEPMPEVAEHMAASGREMPMAMDFTGEIYIRQEGEGMLLGTYEQDSRPWSEHETPWNFDMELLPPDLDRIEPELSVAFQHYPAMATAGIKTIVNGPFTFTPDGNPLVGPVPGLQNHWTACGVMAGLSQGGGVGLSLANWMTDGDPGFDIWGMDVSRFGDYATLPYTRVKAEENYRRRFRITFPNEELPEGRNLQTVPVHDRLVAHNAVFGADFGLESPLWFQRAGREPVENVTFRRSNAFDLVGEESRAVRDGVGMTEVSNFSKYRVAGPGSAEWLQGLFTNTLPKVGRINLTAILNHHGRVIGEFSVARYADDGFFLFSSLGATDHHRRWFLMNMPADPAFTFEVVGQRMVGLSIAGPKSRDVLQAVTRFDVSNENFRFMDFRQFDVGMASCRVGRMTYTGDLGYEIWTSPENQRHVFDVLVEAGEPHGLRLFGVRALLSMRLEKMFGTWFREYRPIFTPYEARMDRYVKLDHDFVGRKALESADPPKRYLSYFEVDPDPDDPADVIGDEPIWHDDGSGPRVVGWVTSGGYAHYSERSLALGYVEAGVADAASGFEIEIIGRRRPATPLREPVLDPRGERMRS
ncbi:MAG: FAD-dependent oxidoreductase [Ilumatobacter sp.]|uniref:GcvT family protein n=1 Tax=Ilumatobacter sp. TaxID=1967498 RepID=UPI0026393235|nr:FAD-dependent oxidoreductase [Ilumatobacter sp.]MDJ0769389.1 FAD-dependent oxidoreductase [Ilumatobacter sp.]